jgi:preprotein translocase subunit SecG
MNLQNWAPYFSAAEIILGITLTVLVLLQTKGSDLGGFFGGGGESSGSFRTRRGIEATMHKVTIYLSVIFFVCTIFAFLAWGQAV